MQHYVFNWYTLPPFFTAFCAFSLGAWVIWRQPASQLRRVLLFGTTCTAVWLGCYGMIGSSADSSTAMLWARLAHLAVPYLPMAIYFYVTVGLRQYQRDKALVWGAATISFVFLVLALSTRLVVSGVEYHWWGYYPIYGPVGGFLCGYFAIAIVLGLAKLWARFGETVRNTTFGRRLTMSAIAGVVLALSSVDFFPVFGVPVYPFGYAPVLVFLVTIFILERRDKITYMTPAAAAPQILRTMQGAVLVTTLDGHIEVSNRAAARLLHREEGALEDAPVADVFSSEAVWRSIVDHCLAGHPVEDLETEWRTADGGTVDVTVCASLMPGEEGEPIGVVLAAIDITNRRRIQRELSEREEQLRQSQKMEAIGQLAGGIAHDFNNLLTAIIGNSTLALATMRTDDPHHPLITEIHEVAERAAGLTKQILAFSRRQMLRPEVTSLNRVVLDMESLLRRSLGEDVELELVLAPELKDSEIDPHQIGQVLLNLAVNARDAMPDGGRLLVETSNTRLDEQFVRTHREVRPGEYVMLAVTDNGHGMDEQTQAHLFEPFFTTKGAGRGTGLGLSTVFGIVKQSGGSVSVYSEVGQGTTFRVYLPVTERAGAVVTAAAAQGVDLPAACGRVFVVEDEAPVRRLVTRVLTQCGYQVTAAASAQDAEAVLASEAPSPDLLLTDVVLPGGVNGRQVADRVLERFPGIPVVFMSGYTRNAVVHDGRVDENVTFLEKPFGPEELVRTVREALCAETPAD